jgi:hypothetical protein
LLSTLRACHAAHTAAPTSEDRQRSTYGEPIGPSADSRIARTAESGSSPAREAVSQGASRGERERPRSGDCPSARFRALLPTAVPTDRPLKAARTAIQELATDSTGSIGFACHSDSLEGRVTSYRKLEVVRGRDGERNDD